MLRQAGFREGRELKEVNQTKDLETEADKGRQVPQGLPVGRRLWSVVLLPETRDVAEVLADGPIKGQAGLVPFWVWPLG